MDKAKSVPAVLASALLLVFLAGAVDAQTLEDCQQAIAKAQLQIAEMAASNFSVTKANDTLQEAVQIFAAQEMLNKSGKKADFSLPMAKANSIGDIKSAAFNAYDELVALEKTVAELPADEQAGLQEGLEGARAEFYSERYDKVGEKVDAVYKKMSEQQALNEKLAAVLDASRRNIAGFFQYNWPYVLAAAAAAVVIFIISANRVLRRRIRERMRTLEMERDVILGLIKDTQKLYFESGKISEDMYNVRLQKFEELIRDIERQLPLLREELELRKGFIFIGGK
jgi:hypothetical protein